MWSGPRTISTALMRAWENRLDTVVVDEPLYGFYLARSGVPHPGRDEIMQSMRCGWREVLDQIRELTEGNGADVVIEAIGRPETDEQAFYARDLAGTVVLVGVPTPEMRLDLPLLDVFGRGGSLKSSWYGDCLPSRDFPMLVDLHLQGRLPLEKFVSETIALDQVEEAFAKMQRGEVLRSVVLL